MDASPATPTPVTLVSHTHGLLPWARRLQLDGHRYAVETWVSRRSHASCWLGVLDRRVGEPREPAGVVLTDSRRLSAAGDLGGLVAHPRSDIEPMPASSLACVAVWYNDRAGGCVQAEPVLEALDSAGRGMRARNGMAGRYTAGLVVPEWGTRAGGQGDRTWMGGCVLAPHACGPLVESAVRAVADMHPLLWQGLALVELGTRDGTLWEPARIHWGWPAVVSDLWLAAAQESGDRTGAPLLEAAASLEGAPQWIMGAPLSVGAWPAHTRGRLARISLEPLRSESRSLVLHDIEMHAARLRCAGADGWIGTAVGMGQTWPGARMQLGAVLASAAETPGVCWRADVGVRAEQVIGALDSAGLARWEVPAPTLRGVPVAIAPPDGPGGGERESSRAVATLGSGPRVLDLARNR